MSGAVSTFLAALPVLASLAGCTAAVVGGAAPGGYGPTNGAHATASANADATITSAINTRYVRDELINAMDVRVSTYQGTVTLSGAVASAAVARRAVDLARSTNGVVRVVSRLNVVSP